MEFVDIIVANEGFSAVKSNSLRGENIRLGHALPSMTRHLNALRAQLRRLEGWKRALEDYGEGRCLEGIEIIQRYPHRATADDVAIAKAFGVSVPQIAINAAEGRQEESN